MLKLVDILFNFDCILYSILLFGSKKMSLGDTSKYIQRLVRVISEKEKMIDQLRRENKDCARINEGRSEAEISMV